MSNYFVILVIAPFVFAQPNYKNIPVTRWVSPDGSKPTTYAGWRAGSSVWCRTFEHGLVYLGPPLGSQVELLVNAGLWVNCESTLTHYVRDLEDENWTVRVDTVRQGSAEDIRSLLQSLPNLEGVVMVGDLPVPWFQMLDDFEQNDTIDGYEEFPVDLFYTDLDGFWSDSLHYEKIDGRDTLVAGQDGIYDQHSGDRAPEIWLGRVTASPLGDEQQLVEHYFDKAHRYRRGELALNVRALIYVDDDWARWAPDYYSDMENLYSARTVIFDPEMTVADDYRSRLGDNYEWISVFAHSWPGGHGFIYNDYQDWSWIYAPEIPAIDPQALFYNLFACSNCRYVETDYMGGRYIFAPTFGLAAIGTTKTGSMLNFKNFYDPLGSGKNIGEAFLEWFDQQPLDSIWARSWFYGMTLLGDPLLRPTSGTGIEETRLPSLRTRLFVHAAPNPFRERTALNYTLADRLPANLTISDPAGRSVRILVRGVELPGSYRVEWDGNDEQGRAVPAGVYFYRLQSGPFSMVGKVIKIPK